MWMDELCSFQYVDVVYGCQCVVYGYVMNYIELVM
jgi:hypothetical protein